MTGGHDPGGAVNDEAVVTLLRHGRLAGVHAHSNAHVAALRPRVPAQRPLRGGGGFRGGTGAREDVEERVALRVDLLSTVVRERPTQNAAMLGQRLAVAIAQLSEQPSRPFDVREQEGDRAAVEFSRVASPAFHGGSRAVGLVSTA